MRAFDPFRIGILFADILHALLMPQSDRALNDLALSEPNMMAAETPSRVFMLYLCRRMNSDMFPAGK